jgi:hypothetical protein
MSSRLQKAVRLVIAIHARDPLRARFVDKSQTFTVRLSLINSLLTGHQPHFVMVTRNPYAMCYRAAMVATPVSRLSLSLEQRLDLAAQHWTNSYQSALDDAGEMDRFMVLRFEDLLNEPQRWLRSVCSFVGLEYHLSMLPAPDHRLPLGSVGSSRGDHKWHPLRRDVNRRYLRQLQLWMVETIDGRVGGLAERWHYTPQGP